jgi:hypothetical protein
MRIRTSNNNKTKFILCHTKPTACADGNSFKSSSLP